MYHYRTAVSSDAPTEFQVQHCPIRDICVRKYGKRPRPISSTRMSKSNQFSFIESTTRTVRAREIPGFSLSSSRKHTFLSENSGEFYPRVRTSVIDRSRVTNRILRSDKITLERLNDRRRSIKPRKISSSSQRREFTNNRLYQTLTNPLGIYQSSKQVSSLVSPNISHIPQPRLPNTG